MILTFRLQYVILTKSNREVHLTIFDGTVLMKQRLIPKGPFICTSNLKIHLVIRASSTETAAPAFP